MDFQYLVCLVNIFNEKEELTKQELMCYNQVLETISRVCQLTTRKHEEILFNESKGNSD